MPPPRAWLLGLAKNAQAPASVLLRLLDHDAEAAVSELAWRRLPEQVVAAVIDHPDPRVRRIFAGGHGAPMEHKARLADDPDPKVRRALVGAAVDFGFSVPEGVLEKLLNDPDTGVRREISMLPLPARLRVALARDPDPEIRAKTCVSAWEHLPAGDRNRLLADTDPRVRSEAELAAFGRHPIPVECFDRIPDTYRRESVAQSRMLARDLAERLATHQEARWRSRVAENPHLPVDLVRRLAEDDDSEVRRKVSTHPALTEEERSAIEVGFDPVVRYHLPAWVRARQDDAQFMRACAASSNVLIRRAAACAENLPADVVERLTEDEDYAVRLLLAEHCRQAPASLLLFIWGSWKGLSRHRLRAHPNFPRQGLARFADDPNPRMRELVFFDDQAPAELIHRLSHDENPEARWHALHDARLSLERVIELLQDPDPNLHRGAAADPRLPLETLLELLDDEKLAEPAATNPALPVETMHRLLDRAGVA
ncbi:PE-PGRS family protein [Thermomonospora echinospora]|uniref:PE-PGRS family protein n=1 Tax=Thermomonospora echinospora TaxID=1992 RepID=UPI0011B0190A|nr:PE-PGRS family protein [Thermomonospora echinospora]